MKLALALFLGVVSASQLEDLQDQVDLLKIEISRQGELEIEKEIKDLGDVAKEVKNAKSVRNMRNSLKKWANSKEVYAIKALDHEFMLSPEGIALKHEIHDFAESLKEHVKPSHGMIHIDNEGLKIIEDEADDIDQIMEELSKSKWAKKYDEAWHEALTSRAAEALGRRFESFSKSSEWAALHKELKDIDAKLKEHVKVSDIPEDWKAEMELLKIHVSPQGQAKIEKEFADVHDTMAKIKMAKSVRNLKNSLEKWAKSAEVAAIHKLDKAFWKSPEGQELMHEIKDFHDALKDHVKKTKHGIHIDNEGL